VTTPSIEISFPQPIKRLSMNDRMHWAQKAQFVRVWRTVTLGFVRASGFRFPSPPQPCFVRVTFPVRDNRRRDSDNPAPTVKAIVDGLVDAGVWPDDSPEWVETLGSRFAKGADLVTVELIPR
jgi:crossover junction endodeoxyribonuclease RusA